jgi:hypothetical protein
MTGVAAAAPETVAEARTLLTLAKERISDEAHWCRYEFALDFDANPVEAAAEDACRWCALGAVMSFGGGYYTGGHYNGDQVAALALSALNEAVPHVTAPDRMLSLSSAAEFNDSDDTSHWQVMDLFDQALDLLDQSS